MAPRTAPRESRPRLVLAVAAMVAALAATAPAAGAAGSADIVGGSPAPAGTWPSIVGLLVDPGPSFHCGGTVIAPEWVVTAAHCVVGSPPSYPTLPGSAFTVIAGRHDLQDQSHGQELTVGEVRVHPSYQRGTVDSGWDAALLHLTSPASVPAMPVATAAGVQAAAYFSTAGLPNAAGWGTQFAGQPSTDPIPPLLEVELPLLSDAQCAAVDPAFSPTSMVCAGTPGSDTCQGDSGGPLTIQTMSGGQAVPVLWGLTSWGNGCAVDPGFYTRVTALGDFLAPAGPDTAVEPPAPPASPPPPEPPAPQPAAPPPAAPSTTTTTAPVPVAAQADVSGPSLSRVRAPRTVRLSGSRPGTSIVLRVTSVEPATLEVSLLRRVSRRGTRQVRGTFRAALAAGANRLVLPRGLWRLRSGSHVLVLRATDAAGNRTTLRMPIRVAVAHRTPTR